jgi:hypothetical protein
MPIRIIIVILIPIALLVYCGCSECEPDCDRKCCGDDGCGGTCPNTCGAGYDPYWCLCGTPCIPVCTGKCCGDDGCGSTCSDYCPAGYVCNQQNCQCEGPVCGSDSDCEDTQCCLDGTCEDMECEVYDCGIDPVCGKECGPCPAGTFCDDSTWNCIEEGKCTQDEHCQPGQICSTVYFRCVDGCRTSDTCPPGHFCSEQQCIQSCDDKEQCDYGQLCDLGTHGCYDDDRGPYCEPCEDSSPNDPHRCGPGPNFCMMTSSDPSMEPFCGVDCDQGQECPRGYTCNSVLIASGGPCRSDQECDSGQCHINAGDEVGFCLCSSDDHCPQDSCDDFSLSCVYTLKPCTPGGSECSDPIPCVDGLCQIGRNCAPMEGMSCNDLKP